MLIIFTILLCVNEFDCVSFDTKNTIRCNIEDENFWKIYRWHFGNATSITIVSLENSHVYNVREFLSEFLHHLYLHRLLTKTFTVKKHVLIEEENDNKHFNIKYEDCECRNKTNKTDLFQTVVIYQNFIRFQRMKRYSCDPETAFLIISWDETDLEKFIDYSYNIFPKPRGSFMIIFVSPFDFSETHSKQLFQKIWKLGVLNVVFRRLCSTNKQNYMFNPFGRIDDDYGVLRNFTVDDKVDINNFVNIMRDLNGYPVDVSLFMRKPTAVKPVPRLIRENPRYDRLLYKSNGFGGLDGTVLSTMSDYLNFLPIVHSTYDVDYGHLESNGTFVGSLGDVVYRTVAISFNGRFVMNYNTNDIEFTTPLSNDMLCLIVPSAEKIPQWLKIFRCFTIDAWLGIFGLYLLITLYWYGLKPIDFRKIKRRRRNCFVAFEVYSFFVSGSVGMPKIDSHRVFFASCMLFSIIMTGTFQSSLVTSFTTTTYYPNIKNLREFDETGLKIGTASVTLSETFNSEFPSELYRSLRSKVVVNATSSMSRAAYKRDMAAIERNADGRMRIKTEFTEQDGFELLHVVRECPRSYYVSYIVSKGSPYFKVFNHVLTMFREAGLLTKWNTDTVDAYIFESRKLRKNTYDKTKVFTLYDIQTAFYLLIIGLCFSSVVFSIELCFIHKKIKK